MIVFFMTHPVFQIKVPFIKLQFHHIKMLDLELYLLNHILWNVKKFGSKYNTLEGYDWPQSWTWWA